MEVGSVSAGSSAFTAVQSQVRTEQTRQPEPPPPPPRRAEQSQAPQPEAQRQPQPVVNAQGQQTGRVINITA